MPDLHLQHVVRASMRQMSAELSGEAVVLNFDDGMYYSLNPVGARVWNLVQEPCKVVDVLDTLLHEYDVDPQRCEADLLGLLGELRRLNLVEVHG